MGRLTYGRWPHPASAYITGISVGILVRSPFLWAYALCALVSIATKYVFRYKDRHLWNPSNFGVSALLFLAPASASVLSIQWGNVIWPMVVIWMLGAVIVWRAGRFHISATYVASFLLLSVLSSSITGNSWLATIAPITGPMYQLFVFFMITDPRTVVRGRRRQIVVAILVAVAEALIRFASDKGWPLPIAFNAAPPLVALAIVGPMSKLVDLRRQRSASSSAT